MSSFHFNPGNNNNNNNNNEEEENVNDDGYYEEYDYEEYDYEEYDDRHYENFENNNQETNNLIKTYFKLNIPISVPNNEKERLKSEYYNLVNGYTLQQLQNDKYSYFNLMSEIEKFKVTNYNYNVNVFEPKVDGKSSWRK